jgi:hypothetical protein
MLIRFLIVGKSLLADTIAAVVRRATAEPARPPPLPLTR